MELKWIGACLLIAGFGFLGFSYGSAYKREEDLLRQLCNHIEFMICELQYHQTPLPQLCEVIAGEASSQIRSVFRSFTDALRLQSEPDVKGCMQDALKVCTDIPRYPRACLEELGKCLGRFDLSGQLRGLESVLQNNRRILEELEKNSKHRVRSYQVFALCAGAAVVVILI